MPKFTIEQLQKDIPAVMNPLLIELHGVTINTKKLTEANLRYNNSLENLTTKLNAMGAEAADITEFVQSLNAPALPEPGKKIIDLSDPFSRIK